MLGLASEDERREVETYARAYPEIKAELEAVELAMEEYAKLQGIETPQGVQAKINTEIDHLEKTSPRTPATPNKKLLGGLGLPLLLAALLLVAGWLAFSNINKAQNQAEEIVTLNSDLETLQTNCDETSRENTALKERVKILQDPDNQVIKLNETPKAPNAVAIVVYNITTKKTYLNIQSLDTPPTNKQYQLWAIVDGKPTDMGVFDLSIAIDGLLEVPFIENPAAFAITLEDLGGKPEPNLDELVLIGEVS